MEKYQIIPRKFRPKRFSEVVGQKAITLTIKNALKQNRAAQAYLFCGGRGCGKTTLARLFAKALNCSHLDEDQEPCNLCQNCKEISEGSNLDIIEIDGASNRGIDDIRQINETALYAPSKGHTKIYIIDEVHMLTKEAFNALLKTLEEPPKNVKFFFATTEPHKVPQTIISRCQRFNLSRIPQTDLVKKLTRIGKEMDIEAEEEALVQISHLAEGSLRDAESLFDQLICYGKFPITLELTKEVFGLLLNEHLFELDEAILTNDIEKGNHLAQVFYQSGKDMNAIMEGLLEHFHGYLKIHLGESHSIQTFAKRYTKAQLLALLDTLIEWQQQMVKIPFKQIHFEMLLLNLIRACHKLSLDGLIQRLLDLENRLDVEAPAQEEKMVEKKQEQSHPSVKKNNIHPSKYDTLVRFAAVELEGSYERS